MAAAEHVETVEARAAALAAASGGRLTAEAVVSDATSKTSPLHRYFEWDDKKAGHQYRLEQARALIRRISVQVTTISKSARVPAYVRDPDAAPNEQGYVATAAHRTDVDFKRDALKMELHRAGWTLERARAIATFFGLGDQTAHLVAGVKELEAALDELK